MVTKTNKAANNFSKLDRDKKFQKFLKKSLENKAEDIDLEKYKKGIRLFDERYMVK